MPTKCTKVRYAFADHALAAARKVHRSAYDTRRVHTYQCPTCRFPDGKRAWHWANARTHSRRKAW